MFIASDYIPDNLDIFEDYERERQARMDKLPRCSECDHPIQDDKCYEFNGELICPNCLKDNHEKWVEDYID